MPSPYTTETPLLLNSYSTLGEPITWSPWCFKVASHKVVAILEQFSSFSLAWDRDHESHWPNYLSAPGWSLIFLVFLVIRLHKCKITRSLPPEIQAFQRRYIPSLVSYHTVYMAATIETDENWALVPQQLSSLVNCLYLMAAYHNCESVLPTESRKSKT